MHAKNDTSDNASTLRAVEDGKDDAASSEVNEKSGNKSPEPYLVGWRLNCTVIGVMFATFLAIMEASVVATGLVRITDDLQDFSISAWIVNAYLVTFTSFMLVWSQFSSVLGRRLLLTIAFGIFIAFSGACAGARTAIQLVIFRAFQGIGGAGVLNISTVLLFEAVPTSAYPKYIALVALLFGLALGVGPLIGGAIVTYTTWRWVFWINLPTAAVILALMLLSVPHNFPHQNNPNFKRDALASSKKLDLVGGLLFLGGSIMLIAAFQGANVSWEWSSATSICLIIFSVVVLILFCAWERHITLSKTALVPLLTYKFAERKPIALFASFILTSFPFTSLIVAFTQRFQILDDLSGLDAGIRLLPFIIVIPIINIVGAILISKRKVNLALGLITGVAFQLIGLICLVTAVPDVRDGPPSVLYGFQVLLAVGMGINNTMVTTGIPLVVEKSLAPTGMGTGNQFRYLGGVLGVGVLAAVFNGKLRAGLSDVLSPEELASIMQTVASVKTLPVDLQEPVTQVFFDSFRAQYMALLGFVAFQVPVALALL